MTVFIHVGLHKTGSTFLQSEVFNKMSDIESINFFNKDFLQKEFEYIQSSNPIYFDKKKIKNLENFFKEKTNNFLISSEQFSGNFNFQITGTGTQFFNNMKMLKDIFPKIKIIIIFRNQLDLLISHYKDEVVNGLTLDFEEWLRLRIKFNSLNFLNYNKTLEFLWLLFGRENVIFDLYENIFYDSTKMKNFLDKISSSYDFNQINFNKRINLSPSDIVIKYNKITNRFIKTKMNTQSFTGKYTNLKIYNILRYHFFPVLSKKFSKKNKKYYYCNDLNKLIVSLKESNDDFFNKTKLRIINDI
jgi:hypothetical protein